MTVKDREALHMKCSPVKVAVEEYPMYLMPKVFTTGSLGWHGQGKVVLSDTPCQVNIVITIIGSKPSVGPTPAATAKPKRERKITAPKNAQDASGESPHENTGLEPPPDTSPLFEG